MAPCTLQQSRAWALINMHTIKGKRYSCFKVNLILCLVMLLTQHEQTSTFFEGAETFLSKYFSQVCQQESVSTEVAHLLKPFSAKPFYC